MKRLTYFIFFVLMFSLLMIGCSTSSKVNQNNSDSEKALSYLKDKGYTIVSINGKAPKYLLTREKLSKLPYQQYWGVQKINANDYINQTIKTFKFTVKNHPLDNYKSNKDKQTIVWVMVCKNKAIGGYSLPDENLLGAVYSIDGKTLEEIKGLNYQNGLKQ